MLICDESSLLQIITFYFLSLIHTLDIIVVVVIVFVVVFVVLEVNLLKNLIVLFVFPRREFRKILISAKIKREREKEAETKLYINI